MECSIKEQKIQAVKKYRRAKFVYNFVLYSLTSIITCCFFSYPFWLPSMKHFLSSLPINISYFLNAKCLFLVGNIIIFILVRESKLKQSSSSSSSDIYDEYVARSRNSNRKVMSKEVEGLEKRLNMEEKGYGEERKKELMRVAKSSIPHDQEKRKGLRSCKSEVWGESKIHVKRREKTKIKNDSSISQEEKEMGMRSCKSEIWGESVILMGGNPKGQKEEEMNHEEKTLGMRSCKSAVWGQNEILQKTKGQKEDEICKSSMKNEEKKMGMRSCKSAVWGENETVKTSEGQKEEEIGKSSMNDEEKKMGMRSCKSAVWGESEISEKYKGRKEEQTMTREDLNERVEAFIARVNKQRLIEYKLVYDNRG